MLNFYLLFLLPSKMPMPMPMSSLSTGCLFGLIDADRARAGNYFGINITSLSTGQIIR